MHSSLITRALMCAAGWSPTTMAAPAGYGQGPDVAAVVYVCGFIKSDYK